MSLESLRVSVKVCVLVLLACLVDSAGGAQTSGLGLPPSDPFAKQFEEPKRVRNVQPVPGVEVTILRSFKIQKGSYEEFHRRSAQEIWPFFEKIGARVIGMWRVDPGAIDPTISRDHDEAILLTRYASLEHWRASRSGIDLGGNGPDAQALAAAHAYRQSVTIETSFKVLRGQPADNGPYFMPAVDE